MCKWTPGQLGKQSQFKANQSQLKPIQSQSKPIQSQSKPIKANKMPKQTQFKPNLSCVASGEAGNKLNPPALAVVNRLVRRVEIPFKSPVAFSRYLAILLTYGTRRRRPALQTLTDGFQSLAFATK
jgi:hypothetical protein